MDWNGSGKMDTLTTVEQVASRIAGETRSTLCAATLRTGRRVGSHLPTWSVPSTTCKQFLLESQSGILRLTLMLRASRSRSMRDSPNTWLGCGDYWKTC